MASQARMEGQCQNGEVLTPASRATGADATRAQVFNRRVGQAELHTNVCRPASSRIVRCRPRRRSSDGQMIQDLDHQTVIKVLTWFS